MTDAPKRIWVEFSIGTTGFRIDSWDVVSSVDHCLYHHDDTVKALTDERDALADQVDDLEVALGRIKQWAEAYDVGIFPEVDSKWLHEAHQTLVKSGKSIDLITANVGRHMLEGVGRIAVAALLTPPKDTP